MISELAVYIIIHVFAKVPDVALFVLRQIIAGIFDKLSIKSNFVSVDERVHAHDLFRISWYGDFDTLQAVRSLPFVDKHLAHGKSNPGLPD